MQSDNLVTILDVENVPVILSVRLSAMNTPPMEKIQTSNLTLQEILIVGNVCDQVSAFPAPSQM